MNKRQRKKNLKNYLKSIQPEINILCVDLATFKNPTTEEASKLLGNAIIVDIEAMGNLGVSI